MFISLEESNGVLRSIVSFLGTCKSNACESKIYFMYCLLFSCCSKLSCGPTILNKHSSFLVFYLHGNGM